MSERIDIFTSKVLLCPEQVKLIQYLGYCKFHIAIISERKEVTTLCGKVPRIHRLYIESFYEVRSGSKMEAVIDYWVRLPGWKQCFYCDRFLEQLEYRFNEMKSERREEDAEVAVSAQ